MIPDAPEKDSARYMKKAKSNLQGAYALFVRSKETFTEELTTVQTGPLTVESNNQQLTIMTGMNLCDANLLAIKSMLLNLESNGF